MSRGKPIRQPQLQHHCPRPPLHADANPMARAPRPCFSKSAWARRRCHVTTAIRACAGCCSSPASSRWSTAPLPALHAVISLPARLSTPLSSDPNHYLPTQAWAPPQPTSPALTIKIFLRFLFWSAFAAAEVQQFSHFPTQPPHF